MSNEAENSAREQRDEPIDVRLIGRSSSTVTYQSTLHKSERHIVLKIWVNPFVPYSQIQQSYALLQAEMRTLRATNNPHILIPLHVRRTPQSFVIVSDYIPEGNLQLLIEQNHHQPLPRQRALTLIHQIGEALQAAHQQDIVHGNLTPHNILLVTNQDSATDQPDDIMLSDFYLPSLQLGRARTREEDHPQLRLYMAPEQFHGTITRLTDQYSLGCLAYQLLTGRPPFEGIAHMPLQHKHTHALPQRPSQLNTELPATFDAPLLKALAKGPVERFADIDAFLSALTASEQAATAPEIATNDTKETEETEEKATTRKNKPQHAKTNRKRAKSAHDKRKHFFFFAFP